MMGFPSKAQRGMIALRVTVVRYYPHREGHSDRPTEGRGSGAIVTDIGP